MILKTSTMIIVTEMTLLKMNKKKRLLQITIRNQIKMLKGASTKLKARDLSRFMSKKELIFQI